MGSSPISGKLFLLVARCSFIAWDLLQIFVNLFIPVHLLARLLLDYHLQLRGTLTLLIYIIQETVIFTAQTHGCFFPCLLQLRYAAWTPFLRPAAPGSEMDSGFVFAFTRGV